MRDDVIKRALDRVAPPKPKAISLRLPADIHEVIEEVAAKNGVSVNSLICEVLRDVFGVTREVGK